MYKCREKNKMPRLNGYKKYISKIKKKNKTLYSKIHKKISLGEYSCLREKRKKRKKKPFQSR